MPYGKYYPVMRGSEKNPTPNDPFQVSHYGCLWFCAECHDDLETDSYHTVRFGYCDGCGTQRPVYPCDNA